MFQPDGDADDPIFQKILNRLAVNPDAGLLDIAHHVPEALASADASAMMSPTGDENQVASSQADGYCRLPDGSLHPYTDAGGGYGYIYGGGNPDTNGQAGTGYAANDTTRPTVPKPGGVGGGGKSGQWTSPASKTARDLTGRARIDGLKPLTGTASVGGSIDKAIPALGTGLMLWDFYNHDTAPYCEPVYDPNRVY